MWMNIDNYIFIIIVEVVIVPEKGSCIMAVEVQVRGNFQTYTEEENGINIQAVTSRF